jgi:hypothetical protein
VSSIAYRRADPPSPWWIQLNVAIVRALEEQARIRRAKVQGTQGIDRKPKQCNFRIRSDAYDDSYMLNQIPCTILCNEYGQFFKNGTWERGRKVEVVGFVQRKRQILNNWVRGNLV